jgi:hypothetical protein
MAPVATPAGHGADMRNERVTIYRNTKQGLYIVQPMATHPTGAVADFGEPTIVSEPEFESRIAGAVLENLAKFDQESYKPERAPRFSREEYAIFKRAHNGVSVARTAEGLEITPWERVHGGYAGINAAIITIPGQAPLDKLTAAIREAFERTR